MDRTLLAVLIDADNVPAKHAEAILKEITSFGEPGLRRVYGDWSDPRLTPWISVARELGLVTHQQAANSKGKNASDIGLVIDAMDILHAGKFDGFVLVSSDSDFTRLASRIREEGLQVYGIGEADKAVPALRNACNRFILIENIVAAPEIVAPALKTDTAEKKDQGSKRLPSTKIVPIVHAAMKAIDPDCEWFGLGEVKRRISQAQPDFDTRSYGYPSLPDLLRKCGQFDVEESEGKGILVRKKPASKKSA